MSSKPKLLFVYDMPQWKVDKWQDGLWAALNLLEEYFEVQKWNLQELGDLYAVPCDFLLGWGGFNSSVDKALQEFKRYNEYRGRAVKMGLCIGGNAFPPTGADKYDVLFYETKWYRPQINFHSNIVHAFGINSDIFNEIDIPTPIVWDYIGVGSLSAWKRWEKMIDKGGNRLVVGEYQRENAPESSAIANHLLSNGIMVSDMVSPYDLANFYHWSRRLYIPADVNGGGERAILEARACGLEVEIEDDNPKLKELLGCPIYDEKYYAEQLKKGILACL